MATPPPSGVSPPAPTSTNGLYRMPSPARLQEGTRAIQLRDFARQLPNPSEVARQTRAAQSAQLLQYEARLNARDAAVNRPAPRPLGMPAGISSPPAARPGLPYYDSQPLNTARARPTALPAAAAATRVPNAVQAGAAAIGRVPRGSIGPGLLNPFAILPAVTGAAKLTGSLALVPVGLVNKDAANLSNSLGEAGRKDHDATMEAIFGPLAASNILDPAKWEKNPLNPFGSAWDWAPWNKRDGANSLKPAPQVSRLRPDPDGFQPFQDPPSAPALFSIKPKVSTFYRDYLGNVTFVSQIIAATSSGTFIPVGIQETTSANGSTTVTLVHSNPTGTITLVNYGKDKGQKSAYYNTLDDYGISSTASPLTKPRQSSEPANLSGAVPTPTGSDRPPQYEPDNRPEYPKKDTPDSAPAAKPFPLPLLPVPARAPSPTPGLAQPPAIPAPVVPVGTPTSPRVPPPGPAAPNPPAPGRLPPLNQMPGFSQLRPPASVTDRGKDPVFIKPATPTNTDLSTQIGDLKDSIDRKPTPLCQYEEDDLATVPIRVYQGENLLTGPVYGVKTIEVHEKMSEFVQEHFNHLSEVRGQAEGLRGRLKKILDRLQIIRIINLMGAVSSIHNAAMLSNNLAQTLGDATSTVITAVGRTTGFMSAEESIDVNQILGETFNDFMKASLGETVWNGTKASWKKANRILSAASQIMFTIRSINDSRREMLEWIGENTGKIGNALKKFGVVGEGAYKWMPEKFNIQTRFEQRITKFREGTETIDDAASSIESVASEVVNVHDEVAELKKGREDFEKLLKEATGKDRPDNDPAKDAAAAAKAASPAKDPTPADMEPN